MGTKTIKFQIPPGLKPKIEKAEPTYILKNRKVHLFSTSTESLQTLIFTSLCINLPSNIFFDLFRIQFRTTHSRSGFDPKISKVKKIMLKSVRTRGSESHIQRQVWTLKGIKLSKLSSSCKKIVGSGSDHPNKFRMTQFM